MGRSIEEKRFWNVINCYLATTLLFGGGFLVLLAPTRVEAQCLGLVKGPLVLDITTCSIVDPAKDFTEPADQGFIKDLTPADRQTFMARYQGLLLSAKVVRSDAIQEGINKQKGALSGKDIKAFLPASEGAQCASLEKKRINVTVDEACCAGGKDSPCLLPTTYVLSGHKLLGAAIAGTGNKQRQVAKKSEAYKKGMELLKTKDPKKRKEAIKYLEEARGANELDTAGLYYLGLSYRQEDECPKAIPVLEVTYKKWAKREVWADEEKTVRKSNFLLLRCYAMTKQTNGASLILNGFLTDRKKFAPEIREAKKPHEDLRWIQASKEYRDFVEAANAPLK